MYILVNKRRWRSWRDLICDLERSVFVKSPTRIQEWHKLLLFFKLYILIGIRCLRFSPFLIGECTIPEYRALGGELCSSFATLWSIRLSLVGGVYEWGICRWERDGLTYKSFTTGSWRHAVATDDYSKYQVVSKVTEFHRLVVIKLSLSLTYLTTLQRNFVN